MDRTPPLADRGRTSAPSHVPDDCSPTRTPGGKVTHRDGGVGRTRARSAHGTVRDWYVMIVNTTERFNLQHGCRFAPLP
jgi:hypothetical protein